MVAAVRFACGAGGADRAEARVREAAARGARLILIPELFEGPCFRIDEAPAHFARARPFEGTPSSPASPRWRRSSASCCRSPSSRRPGRRISTPLRRRTPTGAGSAATASPTSPTGRIGVGICRDQRFPESARAMALERAEAPLDPAAIDSEPQAPGLDSRPRWETAMRGHAGANLARLLAADRIGTKRQGGREATSYRSSFITDGARTLLAQADRDDEAVILAALDLGAMAGARAAWGLFRDRRPDLYGRLARL